MPTRFIETEYDRKMLYRFIAKQGLPFSVTTEKARKRSVDQNRLQRLWVKEIAEQNEGWPQEEVRGYCKLHFGVPIMRADSEDFAKIYDEIIRPLSYEHKIKLMMVPMDLPVTRDMNAKQMTAYLDAVQKHFAEQGIVLTDPDRLMFKAEQAA